MLSETDKAYIAGFLDGDGCIMFQLVRRKDYIFGYQVRASIVFYQKTTHRSHLEWLKHELKYGYVRDRNDGMSEYTIVGMIHVREVLKNIQSYLRLKKSHAALAQKIIEALPKRLTPPRLIAIGRMVDRFQELNYSKKRTNTTKTLEAFFATAKVPRND